MSRLDLNMKWESKLLFPYYWCQLFHTFFSHFFTSLNFLEGETKIHKCSCLCCSLIHFPKELCVAVCVCVLLCETNIFNVLNWVAIHYLILYAILFLGKKIQLHYQVLSFKIEQKIWQLERKTCCCLIEVTSHLYI